ncbi:hypothetical protein J3E69DRAFT_357776 [Trichoderma sp. SZMC 28015]
MDWKSVPKCGRPKQVLLELANDGRSGRGGPVEKRWNKKSPGPAHPCAAPATQASKQGCACMDGFGALTLLRNAMLMRTREEEAGSVRILSGMQDARWFDVCLAVRVLQRQVV